MSRPRRATLKRFDAPGYRPPDALDMKTVMLRLDLNEDQTAALLGFRDGRAVRRWLASPGAKTQAPVPYAAWRLLLLEAQMVPAPGALRQAKP